MEEKEVLLTQEGYEKLEKELEYLVTEKRGEIADNGCIEWFHSVLKSETFYLHKWRNITEDSLTDIVKNYIIFYPDNYVSPLK